MLDKIGWKIVQSVFFLLFLAHNAFTQSIPSNALGRYVYLHSHPELSGLEENTSFFLKKELSTMGFTIIDSLGLHSFAGVLKNGDGPVVMYRTDMDALPLIEKTGVSFSPGAKDHQEKPIVCMHACGHDLHMTTWLEVAEYMSAHKKSWKGTLVFLAQSSEETGQGARSALSAKNYKKLPKVDYQVAFHNTPELESGTVGFCHGYSFAAVDMMNITVKGIGGHGAEPFRTVDPVVLSAYFITEIQSIVSRNLPPNDPAVVTVGAINGGTVGNIIPSEVELKLTIRSYSADSREKIFRRIEEIGNGIALSAGLDSSKFPTYTLLDMSIPSVYNNPELGKRIEKALSAKKVNVGLMPPKMIGEDFGVYGAFSKIPSYMVWIGTSSREKMDCIQAGKCTMNKLHTAEYLPDYETTIPLAINAMSNILIELLSKN